jgi:hypothetical protein
LYTGIILADFEVFVKNPPESVFALLLQLHDTKQNTFVQHKRMKTVRARTKIKFKTFALRTSTWVKTRVSIVYFFLVGACVRIYKILQRNATFLLVTLFFYLHREMCNITVFCTVNQVQAAIFVSSCLSFPFMFCMYFVLCPFIY